MKNNKSRIDFLRNNIHEMSNPIFIRLFLFSPDVNIDIEKKVNQYLDKLFNKLVRHGRAEAIYPEGVCLYEEFACDNGKDIGLNLFIDAKEMYKDTKIENNNLFQVLHDIWIDEEKFGDSYIAFYKVSDNVNMFFDESVDKNILYNVKISPRNYNSSNGMLDYFDATLKEICNKQKEIHIYQYENILYSRIKYRAKNY